MSIRLRPNRFALLTAAAAVLLIGTLMAPYRLPAQSSPSLFAPGDRLEIVQRFNYTLRENGRYQGHVERETRTWLTGGTDGLYRGELMVSENMIHDFRTVAARIESREPVELEFDGERLIRVSGVPIWQALPTVPVATSPGTVEPWEAGAVARVQLPDGSIWSVPTAVRYEPQGVEEYQGQQVLRVAFGYSLQWPLSPMTLEEHPAAGLFDQANLPDRRVQIRANHQGVFLLPVAGGVPVLHRTNITEQLVGTDRTSQERTGFILTWFRSTPPTVDLVARLQGREIPDVEIDRDEMDRVRLSIRNLLFVADQAVLLPGERGRLDDIAELLGSVPESEILVTGHTADVGTQESQMVLSIERAQKMVDELVARGVRPGRLRYEGRGGTDPVGDNSTDEGRAANRRVELRLLSE